MTQYIETIADTREIIGGYGRPDPEGYVGPTSWHPFPKDGVIYLPWQGKLVFGEAPTPTSKFLMTDAGPQWVETASFDELKARKRNEITAMRIAQDGDHFIYQEKQIRTADKDMFDLLVADARINKCIDTEMPPNWPGGWKAIDNTYLPITTKAEWNAFFIAAYDRGILNFQHSQSLKNQLDEATTVEEINAIKW